MEETNKSRRLRQRFDKLYGQCEDAKWEMRCLHERIGETPGANEAHNRAHTKWSKLVDLRDEARRQWERSR